mgnify:CR=1 FL=1
MYLQKLQLTNFRNYESLELEFSRGVNVFVGDNAHGKTNILESIYLSSITKSYRTSKDIECIKFNENYFRINHTFIEDNDSKIDVEVYLDNSNKKQIKENGVKINRYSDFIGTIPLVIFSPDNMDIVKGSPKNRRKFLDILISQLSRSYVISLQEYNKLLALKNNLLKQEKTLVDLTYLDILDEKLAEKIENIMLYRIKYVDTVEKHAQKIQKSLSKDKEILKLKYVSDFLSKNREEIKKILVQSRENDFFRKTSNKGIGHDDILVLVNDKEVATYGSQGQNRTALLTLKLSELEIGYTLCDKKAPVVFDKPDYATPIYYVAIKPKNKQDEEKISSALTKIRQEDPTFEFKRNPETAQLLIGGQGVLHLGYIIDKLKNIFKVEVEQEEPKVVYRETIRGRTTGDKGVQGRHKKQSGGAGQFGEVHLIVEPYYEGMPMPDTYKFNGQEFKMNVKGQEEIPLEWGGKLVFINSVVGGAIDTRFMPAILKGIMSRMEQGPLTGSYARDVRVIVYDGKMHPVDSNEISFMLAGRNAFSEAFKNAGPKILEPIYDVEVFVPSDKMGDVMSDLQGRRGMIMGMSSESGYEKLVAKVPLKEMSNYSTSLSSLTGGRASFIMKFASYELVPGDVQDKLMKEFEASQDKDE